MISQERTEQLLRNTLYEIASKLDITKDDYYAVLKEEIGFTDEEISALGADMFDGYLKDEPEL